MQALTLEGVSLYWSARPPVSGDDREGGEGQSLRRETNRARSRCFANYTLERFNERRRTMYDHRNAGGNQADKISTTVAPFSPLRYFKTRLYLKAWNRSMKSTRLGGALRRGFFTNTSRFAVKDFDLDVFPSDLVLFFFSSPVRSSAVTDAGFRLNMWLGSGIANHEGDEV